MLNPALLDDHQTKALARMQAEDAPNVFICWNKMGTGKTRLGLAAFETSGFHDCLIVCRRVAFSSWMDEMEKMGLDYLVYADNYKAKSIVRLARGKRILLISAGDLKNVPEGFPKGEMLIVDELYLFSNPKVRRSILLQRISLFCSVRIGLSGTIMPAQDNITIYGQLMALRYEKVLARTATEFRSKFQEAARGRFGREYLNKEGANEEIAKLLAHCTDVYFPESRPTRTQILALNKTPQQTKAIQQLEEEYEYNDREYDYALQIVHAVNGLSNGWFLHSDGRREDVKCEKLNFLLSLLDDLVSAGHSVVVWCAYHDDIARIATELKHPWLEFTARVPFNEVEWKKGKIKVVLATEANGSSVNHFGQVKYGIYFSIDFKLLNLQQSMTRHERKNSEHDGAHYYFLQTKGTMDARTYYLVTKSGMSEQELVTTLVREMFDK